MGETRWLANLLSTPFRSPLDWSSYHIALAAKRDDVEISEPADSSFDLRITAMVDLLDCRRNFFISSSTSFSIVHGDIEAMVDRERLFSNLENSKSNE